MNKFLFFVFSFCFNSCLWATPICDAIDKKASKEQIEHLIETLYATNLKALAQELPLAVDTVIEHFLMSYQPTLSTSDAESNRANLEDIFSLLSAAGNKIKSFYSGQDLALLSDGDIIANQQAFIAIQKISSFAKKPSAFFTPNLEKVIQASSFVAGDLGSCAPAAEVAYIALHDQPKADLHLVLPSAHPSIQAKDLFYARALCPATRLMWGIRLTSCNLGEFQCELTTPASFADQALTSITPGGLLVISSCEVSSQILIALPQIARGMKLLNPSPKKFLLVDDAREVIDPSFPLPNRLRTIQELKARGFAPIAFGGADAGIWEQMIDQTHLLFPTMGRLDHAINRILMIFKLTK